jgi:phenylpropionate dioxygenase-like ring-hydroxylating dioxygenase large terminal subunit
METARTRIEPVDGFDNGTAYGRPQGRPDLYLTQVGAGTPGGEFWRRYWNPVALSEDATTTPTQIRILGEDLILFRNGRGEPGLLYPRCVHRGTSLIYGKCEDDGIRCCYHGWKFAPDGTCLDQPCEPPRASYPQSVRQPWYPVQEQYGAIWAYMGPPEKKPLLPKYDIFEELEDGDYVEANDMGRSTGGVGKRFIAPWNWLQHWENVLDPAHVNILHVAFSGYQLSSNRPTVDEPWHFEVIEDGVRETNVSYFPDGRRVERTFQVKFPGEKRAADPYFRPGRFHVIGWTVPVDDTHMLTITISRFNRNVPKVHVQLDFNGKSWPEMTEAERRDAPGDYEAQAGLGPITLHSEERLATSDRGIVMARRALRKQIEIVEAGGDPAGVIFDPAHQIIKVTGGNVFSDPVPGGIAAIASPKARPAAQPPFK